MSKISNTIVKIFQSTTSEDIIEVNHFFRSHKSLYKVVKIDDISENLKLLNESIEYLKLKDIKWVYLENNNDYIIPQNTIWYKDKKTGNISCHIEDFEKFFIKNISKIINEKDIHVNFNDNDGWSLVLDKKKKRKRKLSQIKKDINSFDENWNNL